MVGLLSSCIVGRAANDAAMEPSSKTTIPLLAARLPEGREVGKTRRFRGCDARIDAPQISRY